MSVLPGIKSKVICVFGICTTYYTEGNGCPKICGQPNCDTAKDPGTCDLTKQLTSTFSGETVVKLNSKFKSYYL